MWVVIKIHGTLTYSYKTYTSSVLQHFKHYIATVAIVNHDDDEADDAKVDSSHDNDEDRCACARATHPSATKPPRCTLFYIVMPPRVCIHSSERAQKHVEYFVMSALYICSAVFTFA